MVTRIMLHHALVTLWAATSDFLLRHSVDSYVTARLFATYFLHAHKGRTYPTDHCENFPPRLQLRDKTSWTCTVFPCIPPPPPPTHRTRGARSLESESRDQEGGAGRPPVAVASCCDSAAAAAAAAAAGAGLTSRLTWAASSAAGRRCTAGCAWLLQSRHGETLKQDTSTRGPLLELPHRNAALPCRPACTARL